jgi:hypothetical protein
VYLYSNCIVVLLNCGSFASFLRSVPLICSVNARGLHDEAEILLVVMVIIILVPDSRY